MPRYQEQLTKAVQHFWKTRRDQAEHQGSSTGIKDYGSRGATTGGGHMDGFCRLIHNVLVESGIPAQSIYTRDKRELPVFDTLEDRGVLFLNSSLTISCFEPEGRPERVFGHIPLWRPVTHRVVQFLAARPAGHVVYILLGAKAHEVFEQAAIRRIAEQAGTWKTRVDVTVHPHPNIPPGSTAFYESPNPFVEAHALLAAKVAYMMGRKFEEGDWAEVYCKAKGIPVRGWSNLKIDIMDDGLGVEHKMLCYRSDADLAEAFGQTIMHPAATRSIRVPPTDVDANEAMREIFQQYAALIRQRTDKVRETTPAGKQPDMRTGWLLWQDSLRQFRYFEEPMLAPDAKDFYAEWHDSGGGARKASRNLWVFDKATGHKRYSITTAAGAKIQPYFDVPPPNDPNVYLFTVIGEVIGVGMVRVWLTIATFRELKRVLGDFDTTKLSEYVLRKLEGASPSLVMREGDEPPQRPSFSPQRLT